MARPSPPAAWKGGSAQTDGYTSLGSANQASFIVLRDLVSHTEGLLPSLVRLGIPLHPAPELS